MKDLDRGEFLGESGVYSLVDKKRNKIYVGSTTDLYKRINGHKNALLDNRHHSYYLQNHVNKYGLDCIEVKILHICFKDITRKELFDLEQLYLNEQLPNWKNCFNSHKDVSYFANNADLRQLQQEGVKKSWENNYDELCGIVMKNLEKARESLNKKLESGELVLKSPMKGKKHKEDSKAKMSVSAKKRGRHLSVAKEIHQYSMEGDFIKSWECSRDFIKSINKPKRCSTNVSNCALGRKKTAYNFRWSYIKKDKL